MLHLANKEHLLRETSLRKGETKLGETLQTVASLEYLEENHAAFALLGLREDIGIRANLGLGGATTAWDYTLKALCNMQENRFNKGKNIIVLGALHFDDLLKESEKLDTSNPEDLNRLRGLTASIDLELSELVKNVIDVQKTPIIIGGGHNNVYGNLKGVSSALQRAVNALNIDPHTDYRSMEGRHSGNGFRYAKEENYLNKYAVWGLHESYNANDILELFENDPKLHYQSFEDIVNLANTEKQKRLKHVLHWLGTDPLGLELDLDSVAYFPASALTPSGFSLNEVRQIVMQTCSLANIYYFHICEASPGRANSEMEKKLIGKSLAYLITDFVKSKLSG